MRGVCMEVWRGLTATASLTQGRTTGAPMRTVTTRVAIATGSISPRAPLVPCATVIVGAKHRDAIDWSPDRWYRAWGRTEYRPDHCQRVCADEAARLVDRHRQ